MFRGPFFIVSTMQTDGCSLLGVENHGKIQEGWGGGIPGGKDPFPFILGAPKLHKNGKNVSTNV